MDEFWSTLTHFDDWVIVDTLLGSHEKNPDSCEKEETKKPVVKRNKLGTTTITNVIADGQRSIEQDVQLLEDLNKLAVESKKHVSLKSNCKPEGAFSHPLANSLLKLREINLEIQRLRCLTQTENLQVDKTTEERRARSYSCPDSITARNTDRMAHGVRRRSGSLTSCGEENVESRLPGLTNELNEEAGDNLGEEDSHGKIKCDFVQAESQDFEEGEIETEKSLLHESERNSSIESGSSLDEAPGNEDANNDSSKTFAHNEPFTTDNLKTESERFVESTSLGDNVGDSSLSDVADGSMIDRSVCSTEEENSVLVAEEESTDDQENSELNVESPEDIPSIKVADSSIAVSQNQAEAMAGEYADANVVHEDLAVATQAAQDEATQSFDQQDFVGRSGNNMMSEMRMLTAVTEETEEELLELDVKETLDPNTQKSHSMEELKALRRNEERLHRSAEHVNLPRVVLRKGILKKDRPLSDNYENIKMVARESQFNRLGKMSDSDDSVNGLDKRKSKSLDAILIDEENGKSPSLTSSQLSLSDIHGSVESLRSMDRLEPQGLPLYRTKSIGSSSRDHRASLNDITFSVQGDLDEPAPMLKKKRSRFSFKRKSKSTTSLDKKGIGSQDDERRRTIMGGISTERLFASRKGEEYDKTKRHTMIETSSISNRDSGIDSTCELRLDDIMLTTAISKDGLHIPSISEIGLHPSKDRTRSSSEISGDRDTEDDELDIDTDEGTSSEIAERVRKSSVCTEEKKKEKKFGILRKNKKEKKSGKDKEQLDKGLKKSHKDGKTSFLGKKHSFRQGTRPASMNISSSDSKMFARGSSMGKPGSGAMQSASMDNLRSSGRGRPSPTGTRKNLDVVDGVTDVEHLSTNLNSALSSSLGSLNLEEVADAPFEVDDLSQYDSDLDIKNEPETWSDLVEKKVQRKLHAKDIKRQDVMYELIFTESNYVRTLKIVSRIYCVGFRRELGMDEQTIKALFPRLDDLLEINGKFCERLKKRQLESNNNVIEEVGDILVDQFDGPKGEFMKEVYGYFCSRHLQAVALYKELMKTDKKFALFVRKCMLNERVRRLSIPECITLATQRLTKYPLLFEAVLKATKEAKSDYENLRKSITKVKQVLMAVDEYVRDYDKQQQLLELKRKFDPRGEVQFKNGQTFKNSKLFSKRSALMHDGTLTWKGKGKTLDVRVILLADKIFFCHEKDQRYSLVSIDSKCPVIYLKSLMAREVATDMKALFLFDNEGPEMYEMVCPSIKSKKQWMQEISASIKNRPDEEEENQSDLEEELRKEEEHRLVRLKEIMESLQVVDYQFVNLIADKNKLVVEMRELIEKMGSSSKSSTSNLELTATDVLEGRETLEKAISEASSLTAMLYDSEMHLQNSQAQQGPSSGPKRAETFGGFDRNSKTLMPPIQVSRASSLKQENRLSLGGKTLGILENNIGSQDPKERVRKTSQGIMSVIGRSKPNESSEDLSSASSSNSNLAPVSSATAQKILAVTQLKDCLTSLMDITNKQDIELASIRVELQESRVEINKLRSERHEIEEKLVQQQKEHERQISRQKESSTKLERTVEKLTKQFNEVRYLERQKRMQVGLSGKSSKSNSLSSLHNKNHKGPVQEHSGRLSHNRDDSDDTDVIFF
ncbi:rho guanine nucleotide exchange factor 18-like isoform X2 [Rhopilema esculentum]|uniref:rho guanine nucleotide exchange factor 18-like isoform X2 n=1 Tax=Rhopilema esculentum TaxID=499914 RepID=UPI0031CE2E5E